MMGRLVQGGGFLQLLLKNGIEARAVFVVRYYGGTKIGPDRFQCYEEAVKGALIAHPFNTVTRWEQTIAPKEDETNEKTPVTVKQPRAGGDGSTHQNDTRRGTPRGRYIGMRGNPGPISLSKARGSQSFQTAQVYAAL